MQEELASFLIAYESVSYRTVVGKKKCRDIYDPHPTYESI